MEKKKILIVDDEVMLASMIKINLEETQRYEARTENSSKKAIETIKEFKPDLIIMDINMPEMEGDELAWKIRESGDTSIKNIPIVFLTATATKKDERRYANLNIGGVPVLAKPVNLVDLIEAIENNLVKKS